MRTPGDPFLSEDDGTNAGSAGAARTTPNSCSPSVASRSPSVASKVSGCSSAPAGAAASPPAQLVLFDFSFVPNLSELLRAPSVIPRTEKELAVALHVPVIREAGAGGSSEDEEYYPFSPLERWICRHFGLPRDHEEEEEQQQESFFRYKGETPPLRAKIMAAPAPGPPPNSPNTPRGGPRCSLLSSCVGTRTKNNEEDMPPLWCTARGKKGKKEVVPAHQRPPPRAVMLAAATTTEVTSSTEEAKLNEKFRRVFQSPQSDRWAGGDLFRNSSAAAAVPKALPGDHFLEDFRSGVTGAGVEWRRGTSSPEQPQKPFRFRPAPAPSSLSPPSVAFSLRLLNDVMEESDRILGVVEESVSDKM